VLTGVGLGGVLGELRHVVERPSGEPHHASSVSSACFGSGAQLAV
jgi:hypothetical protein